MIVLDRAWIGAVISLLLGLAPVGVAAQTVSSEPRVETNQGVLHLTILVESMDLREPVSNADIRLENLTNGSVTQAVTDIEGQARLLLLPGAYRVELVHPDFEPYRRDEGRLSAGQESLRIRMRRPAIQEIVIDREEEEWAGVQREVVTAEELRRIPGSFGDPIRALQSLPGVARPAGVEGDIILRGAEASNTGFYFDDMPVPYVFHPFIGKSIVDPALVDDVEFYAGGMPSRFGEVLQGVVNIRTGVDPVSGIRQHFDLNLFDGGYAIEAQDGRWVLRAGGRYSWIGALVGGITRIASDSFRPLVIPKYWDFSAHVDYDAGTEHLWSFNLLSSRDRLILNFEDGADETDDESSVDLPFDPDHLIDAGFVRLRLRHRYRSENWRTDSWVAAGPESRQNLIGADLSNQVGVQNGRIGGQTLIGRHESRLVLDSHRRWLLGGQAQSRWLAVEDFTDAYSPTGGVVTTEETQVFAALWSDWQGEFGPWTLVPGLRGGLYHFNSDTWLLPEPRFGVRREWSETLSLKAFLGRFGQAPSMEMTASGVGNPTLGLMNAWQASFGGEWESGAWRVDSSVYGSVMDDLVQEERRIRYATQDGGYAIEESYSYYVSTTGYAFGWESLIRLEPSGAFFGWVSLNIGKSIRVDEGGNRYPADADIPVSLTVLGAWDAPRSWNLSSRYRITSGRPYTELHGVYDANWDIYRPLTGTVNAGRLPVFQQLDVRIEKTWTRTRSDRTLYLDVQNLTWEKNPIFASYNYDYTELVPGLYLPMIALLGMEMEF